MLAVFAFACARSAWSLHTCFGASSSGRPGARPSEGCASDAGPGRRSGVNIVMPMAGRGSRFSDVGHTVPKPMIDVKGKPMYAWAMDSLPLKLATG